MKQFKRYVRLYSLFLSQHLKAMMHSRVDFLVGFMAFFLIQFGGLAFIALVFQQIPDLMGFGLNELLFIYGFANIPRGIDHIFTDNLWILAGNMIVTGEYDRFLLRPLPPLFQIIAQRFQPDGIGEVAIGVGLVIYATVKLSLEWTMMKLGFFLLLVLLATLIYTSIKLILASLAFWFKRSQSVLFLFYSISEFSKYPLEIYNHAIRTTLTFIIPFALTAYIPAAYFLGRISAGEVLLKMVGMTIVLCWMGLWIFHRGSTIYESAGN